MKYNLLIILILISINIAKAEDKPRMFAPENWSEQVEDFNFVFKWGDNKNLTLEIATDENFENIIHSGSSRWVAVEDWMQYSMPISAFNNTLYLWRVRKGEEVSPTYYFMVAEQNDLNNDYKIIRDTEDYNPVYISGYDSKLAITSLWMNVDTENSGWKQYENGNYCQDFIVKDNIIYIPFGDISTGEYFLYRYNASTGEPMANLNINYGGYSHENRTIRNILLDDAGNVVITYMSNNRGIHTYHLLHVIDVSNGNIINEYRCKLPDSSNNKYRYIFSHTDISGDIQSGNFKVYSGIGSENSMIYVFRWEFSNGSNSRGLNSNLTYSHNFADMRIKHIKDDYLIIDNADNMHPMAFDWKYSTNEFTTSFNAVTEDLKPTDYVGTGAHIFYHGKVPMMIYCSQYNEGIKFNLATLSDITNWSTISKLWTFPEQSLGISPSSLPATVAFTEDITPDGNSTPKTNVYIYSNGLGLAAYTLTHLTTTGIEDISNEIEFKYDNSTIKLSDIAKTISIYNIYGTKMLELNSTDEVSTKTLTSGIYFMRINNEQTYKFIVK